MAKTISDTSLWIGLEAPDGLLYSIQELTSDSKLLAICASTGSALGGVVFSNPDETIVATGPFFSLAKELLIDAPKRLRSGQRVNHLPYEGDSPVELTVEGGTLKIHELSKGIIILMPLNEALSNFDEQALAFNEFSALLAKS